MESGRNHVFLLIIWDNFLPLDAIGVAKVKRMADVARWAVQADGPDRRISTFYSSNLGKALSPKPRYATEVQRL